jgi:hypothetical protein
VPANMHTIPLFPVAGAGASTDAVIRPIQTQVIWLPCMESLLAYSALSGSRFPAGASSTSTFSIFSSSSSATASASAITSTSANASSSAGAGAATVPPAVPHPAGYVVQYTCELMSSGVVLGYAGSTK